jgi:squalene-hopene/tetraprenyl-beta-curcumene cyclase
MLGRAVEYLLQAQNPDGGWGGDRGVPSTVEESALAMSALAEVWGLERAETVGAVLQDGLAYLERRLADGTWTEPTPLGLYFASLWYSERLYPVVWTVEALGRLLAVVEGRGIAAAHRQRIAQQERSVAGLGQYEPGLPSPDGAQ